MGMSNTTIAHSYYKGLPLNKSHNIKVSILQVFVITKEKNTKQTITISGVWVTNLPIDSSNLSVIIKAAQDT